MKKLLLILLIFFLFYIISIFKFPAFAVIVWTLLWTENFNEFMLKFSDTYNEVVTDIPSKDEVLDTYNKTISWAIIVKDKIVNWLDTSKSFIDEVRVTFSWSEEKINEIKENIDSIKDTYEDTKEIIDDTVSNISEIKDKIEVINDAITNTWDIN